MNKSLKIWHISDTHTYHELLKVPDGIDMVIFSGDCSNPRDPYMNEPEVREFLHWFKQLPIDHKVMIAGNHDSSIEKGLLDRFMFHGIHYLENDWITIEGIKIWGSPYTPTFGNWCFMKSRHKIGQVWEHIPDDTDIIVVHGPPKGILDLTYDRANNFEMCGCNFLRKRVDEIKPKLVLFGHIHNNKNIVNAGVLHRDGVVYSNGSVVTDGKFGHLSSNGNILKLNDGIT